MLPHPESRFVEARALFIEARFRGRVVGARLLLAGDARAFTIGAARRADAPVDPAFLPVDVPANDNHALVASSGAGFVINLSPAMRARLESDSRGLRVPCGEVVFDISESAPTAAVPRPWLGRAWLREARYLGGVAAALLVALAIIYMVPPDPHALSLDDVGRTVRLDRFNIMPAVVTPPPPSGGGVSSGGEASAAGGPSGVAGDSRAPRANARRSRAHAEVAVDAATSIAQARSAGVLALLDVNRSAAVTRVLTRGEALGDNEFDIIGHVVATNIDRAFGNGGLGDHGTGAYGADTGHGLLGDGDRWTHGLPGIGPRGRGPGFDRGAGVAAALPGREPRAVEFTGSGVHVSPGLDKEIVRRIVRRHLNEVRFCYSEALARQPTLAGRVVVQFAIASTGRVSTSVVQSSTLSAAVVERCIVDATKRWEYPKLDGAGVVIVSYPFQLMPAGD